MMWTNRTLNRDMNAFQHAYLRTLRQLYDTEKQISVTLGAVDASRLDPGLGKVMAEIARQSGRQLVRLDVIFRALYLEPRGQGCWAATALLRDAWESTGVDGFPACTEGLAAALLGLKRYELSLYETLLRWSVICAIDEALPGLRKCIAEELMQTAALAEYAFETAPVCYELPSLHPAALN